MKNSQIRVLQIIRHMNVGGAETFIMNVYRNIDKEKVQFDFLVNGKGYFDEEIEKLGGKIFYMDYITEVGHFRYKKQLLNFFKEHPEYKVCGDLEYLNLKGYKGNLFETMLLLKSKEHLVKDIFTLKAVYLKD